MKRKFLLIVSVFLVLIMFSSKVWATPILNNPNDAKEDNSDGSIFDKYQNSGTLIGVYSGNDNLSLIEGHINNWYASNGDTTRITIGSNEVLLSLTGWNRSKNTLDNIIATPEAGEEYKVDLPDSGEEYYSGIWNAFNLSNQSQTETISFYSVKASTAYALYFVDPADFEGSWSVFDIDASGNTRGKGVKAISHYIGVAGGVAHAPEPATLMLFGVGLLGIAGISRKR